jgi:hypothetical protein
MEREDPWLGIYIPVSALDEGTKHIHPGKDQALYSVQSVKLISFRNTTNTNRSDVEPNIWAPHGSFKWTHKIHHQTH